MIRTPDCAKFSFWPHSVAVANGAESPMTLFDHSRQGCGRSFHAWNGQCEPEGITIESMRSPGGVDSPLALCRHLVRRREDGGPMTCSAGRETLRALLART